ncbi:Fic/DOC family N-terminal domain-containing protein [Micromonospora sp. WMMD714]|uniref:Fic family protein n=1 Tax=Micromonospora sp. WMMD714 TaxID=3016097 RepID=UPI00249B8ED8|nr:Fic/DOC family N-terminal domain-containing protein [Micromonospora sp. WMMD714]WFE62407.1 Fic/DOC family N-terminal domain-containing protein [Micromonospora sp. WMMD714]
MEFDAFATSPVGVLVPISGHDARYGESYDHLAFLPNPLPSRVELEQETFQDLGAATAAIARLDQAAIQLPNPMLLARPTIRREAVSTSALEGTYATLDEVIEADFLGAGEISAAVGEVVNYVRAAEMAYEWIKDRPITIGMLRQLQKVLVQGTRGETADAGNIRSVQVFIGLSSGRVREARFVPPPPGDQLAAGFEAWETWINARDSLPLIVKMALGHYQFETLHPFNDGNGRLGRLVCVLQLARAGELRVPVLDLSPWFEVRRREYQDHLLHISMTGDFDPWVRFFCEAVRAQAVHARERIDALLDWRGQALDRLKRAKVRGVAIRIVEDLIGYPMITPTAAAQRYDVSYQAANTAIRRLEEQGILRERTGGRYARVFAARDVLRIIEER